MPGPSHDPADAREGDYAAVPLRTRLDEWAKTAWCKYCKHVGLRIEWRLEAKPLGTWSLAGMQPKTVASEWPYAICNGCGHESRGQV